ncbi:MAG: tetratricopeptide repeat protein, partial [Chloroflexota bacterium]
TRTKIVPPTRRPDLVRRPRLLSFFDTLLDFKLFIISAQAGYGKTSLLVDMIDQSEIPACWLSIDDLDRDPHRFLAHFIEAISHRFPDFGKKSRAALNSSNRNLDVQNIANTIINEAFETIDEHFTLILDDYHLVDSVDLIEHFINQFIQDMHENIHIIIASRKIVNIPDITLLVARGQVDGLDFSDLAFQVNEVQSLLQQNYHIHLKENVVAELIKETEGWITGLLLSTKTVWQSLTDKSRVTRTSGVDVYEYLAKQVLDQQPPVIREFLLYSSLLEEFNSELCTVVLGEPPGDLTWQQMIDEILQKNLFVIPIEGEEIWLRYHHLFRDFLQAQFSAENPEKVDGVLLALADEYTIRQEWEKAYALYRRTGGTDAGADFIEKVNQPLWDAGRILLLEQWLNALSPAELTSRPILLARKATISCEQGDIERGFDYFSQAEKIFSRTANKTELARVYANRASWQYVQGNYMAALEDVDNTLNITGYKKSMRRIWAEATKAQGASLASLGHLNEGIKYLHKALSANEELGLDNNAASCCIDLGMFLKINGDYEAAIKIYRKGIAYYKKVNNTASYATQLNNLGVHYHFLGNLEDAKSTLEESLILAKNIRRPRLESAVLASMGDLYLDLDATEAAESAYLQAQNIENANSNNFLNSYLALAQVKISRIQNNNTKVTQQLNKISIDIDEQTSITIRGMINQEYGALAESQSNHKEAIRYYEIAVRIFSDGGLKSETAQAKICLAYAWYNAGEVGKAIDALKQAFKITNKLNNYYPLIPLGQKRIDLLDHAKEFPETKMDAERLISKIEEFNTKLPALRQAIRQTPSLIPFAPPRLTIQSFGREQVIKDGQVITAPEWKNRKNVRDLFFLLLAYPEGLSKEEIGLHFWPDVPQTKLKMN